MSKTEAPTDLWKPVDINHRYYIEFCDCRSPEQHEFVLNVVRLLRIQKKMHDTHRKLHELAYQQHTNPIQNDFSRGREQGFIEAISLLTEMSEYEVGVKISWPNGVPPCPRCAAPMYCQGMTSFGCTECDMNILV